MRWWLGSPIPEDPGMDLHRLEWLSQLSIFNPTQEYWDGTRVFHHHSSVLLWLNLKMDMDLHLSVHHP